MFQLIKKAPAGWREFFFGENKKATQKDCFSKK